MGVKTVEREKERVGGHKHCHKKRKSNKMPYHEHKYSESY